MLRPTLITQVKPNSRNEAAQSQLSFGSFFRQTDNAMAISNRLVQAREKPSGSIPIMKNPNKASMTAKTKAKQAKMMSAFTILDMDMTYLLSLGGS